MGWMNDDSQFLSEFCRTGSESAFRQLVERHLNLVYSAALRMVNGDAHLAQDISRLVFSNLVRKARSLPTNVLLAGWLHRDTRFTALAWLRKEHRRAEREREAATMRELESAGDIEWSRLRPVLDEVLDELDDDDRHALLLRFFEQQNLAAVGGALGIAEEAARKRISRALDRLRGVLAARGIHSTNEALAGSFASRAMVVAPIGLAATIATTAVAGAATATATATGAGTLTALKLMTMTKLQLTLVGAVVIAGVTTPLVMQHQSAARLRQENTALRQQLDERDTVATENEQLKKLLAEADRRQPLVAPSRELLRLRGEIGVLRQQNQELSRLLAQRAAPAEAEGFEPSTAWADSGTATPEAAANTFAWAAMTRNTNRLADVLIVPEEAGTNIEEFLGAMSLILHPAVAKIKGSRLVFTETSTNGEVTYLFQNQLADGNTEMSPLTLKQVDGNWKVKLPFVVDKKPERLEGP
jgi:RNA polymerase sigma factor (sigma-70 family)